MTVTDHKAELLTATSALALYDGATTTADKVRAAAAMAHVLRALPAAPVKAARKSAAPAETGVLNAQNLVAALKRVCAIVERRNTVPILSNVMLTASGGVLTLNGTDLDIDYQETLGEAPELLDFATTVSAAALLAVLNGCKGGVSLTMQEDPKDGPRLVVVAGGATHRFLTLPVGDFPMMLFPDAVSILTMPTHALAGPLAFVQEAISTEETRYYLNGAYLHVGGGLNTGEAPELRFTTTDGHRLLLAKIHADPALTFKGMIITRKTVGWLLKHLPADAAMTVEVSPSADDPRAVRFTTPRGVLTCKIIDGSYPDYMRVIPRLDVVTEIKRVVDFRDAKAAAEVIGRLGKMSPNKSRSMVLSVADGRLSISLKNAEGGNSEAEVPGVAVETPHEPMAVGFNSNYLLDVLALGDNARMFLTDPAYPARVEWADKPGCVGVLMPLRV